MSCKTVGVMGMLPLHLPARGSGTITQDVQILPIICGKLPHLAPRPGAQGVSKPQTSAMSEEHSKEQAPIYTMLNTSQVTYIIC